MARRCPAAPTIATWCRIQPIGDDDGDVPLQVPRSVHDAHHPRRASTKRWNCCATGWTSRGYGNAVGKRVVLTGGASQLAGLPEAARRILGRNVRIGRPLGVAGLPEAAKGPAFSTAVGLLIYPQVARASRAGRGRGLLRLQDDRHGRTIATE